MSCVTHETEQYHSRRGAEVQYFRMGERCIGFGDKVFASRDRTVLFSIGCWQHKQLSHTNQKFMDGKKVEGFSADRRWENREWDARVGRETPHKQDCCC